MHSGALHERLDRFGVKPGSMLHEAGAGFACSPGPFSMKRGSLYMSPGPVFCMKPGPVLRFCLTSVYENLNEEARLNNVATLDLRLRV